jgi:excisionase family DNA binding protein
MTHKVTALHPDVFEAIVNGLAEALADHYRTQWNVQPPREADNPPAAPSAVSPWLTVKEAAKRARCSPKILYREANVGRLRVARVGVGRNMRFHVAWVDEWLTAQSNRSLRAK